MKKHDSKFSLGSLFICSKCGKDFSEPENAENLKSSLRSELKNDNEAHKKIRVMVSGCLGVCEKGEQAFGYYPNQGKIELYTTESNKFEKSKSEILDFIKLKIN
jgi:predicted metal-binding protein